MSLLAGQHVLGHALDAIDEDVDLDGDSLARSESVKAVELVANCRVLAPDSADLPGDARSIEVYRIDNELAVEGSDIHPGQIR